MKKLQLNWITIVLLILISDLAAAEPDRSIAEKLAACAGCHGPDGNSLDSDIPRLAGQNAEYLISQLNAFQSGERLNATMQAMAATLTTEDIAAISQFYAQQTTLPSIVDKQLAISGKSRYTACWGCHGMNGEGNEGYPRLADQHPAYVVKQINDFKNKTRTNAAMNSVANQLSDEDIEAIGAYLGSINIPAMTVAR